MQSANSPFLTDTHAHLHFSPLSADIEGVLERAVKNGVKRIINIGTSLEDSRKAVDIAEKYCGIYAAVGTHPHDAERFTHRDIAKFEELLSSPKALAVGEVGLDFYRNLSSPKVQEEVFSVMVDIASARKTPLIIHSRQAAEDTARVLRGVEESIPIILHCFDGSEELIDFGLSRKNLFFSFAGNLTYKKAEKIANSLSVIALDRVLIETDSPYLAPQPLRGKDNEPSFIVNTAGFLAEKKGVSYNDLALILEDNLIKIFGELEKISG
ncbi:MAG: TatD family hydrolase [Deferribacteraceae bacterium]|jgi:TatD DNase family protein|nr:TatD family hydrolase [Deferribacteraceae bacterium]